MGEKQGLIKTDTTKMFTGRGSRDLKTWLEGEAEVARSNEDLARRFVTECRRIQTILPRVSVIERLCADALVAAERRVEARIADRLDAPMRDKLDALLSEDVDGWVSRFVRCPAGHACMPERVVAPI